MPLWGVLPMPCPASAFFPVPRDDCARQRIGTRVLEARRVQEQRSCENALKPHGRDAPSGSFDSAPMILAGNKLLQALRSGSQALGEWSIDTGCQGRQCVALRSYDKKGSVFSKRKHPSSL